MAAVGLGALAGLSATPAAAGSWSSSGGDLTRDEHNPWFVQNTQAVRYCLKIATDDVSLDAKSIQANVRRAFAFWKHEFGSVAVDVKGNSEPIVQPATQQFVEVDCADDVPLVFQFGVLSTEQARYLGDPKQHIGTSVRTDYDRATLSAKGFVYIAPDRGPLSFVTDEMPRDPWSLGGGHLMYLVLLHELGHVFGLIHQGPWPLLMSVQFVENLFLNGVAEGIAAAKTTPTFFGYEGYLANEYCLPTPFLDPRTPRFVGLPAGWQCLKLQMDLDSFIVLGKPTAASLLWTTLGEGHYASSEVVEVFDVITAYIDRKVQTVFPSPLGSNYLHGPKKVHYRKVGTYEVAATGERRKIFATFLDYHLSVGGLMDGDVIFDLTPLPLDFLVPHRR